MFRFKIETELRDYKRLAAVGISMPKLLDVDVEQERNFPTNFVVQGETLYYIDFECNEYMEQWDNFLLVQRCW